MLNSSTPTFQLENFQNVKKKLFFQFPSGEIHCLIRRFYILKILKMFKNIFFFHLEKSIVKFLDFQTVHIFFPNVDLEKLHDKFIDFIIWKISTCSNICFKDEICVLRHHAIKLIKWNEIWHNSDPCTFLSDTTLRANFIFSIIFPKRKKNSSCFRVFITGREKESFVNFKFNQTLVIFGSTHPHLKMCACSWIPPCPIRG